MNDNAPKFEEEFYMVGVPKAIDLGASIVKLQAHDVDSGLAGKIQYAIAKDSNSSSKFRVDPQTGKVICFIMKRKNAHSDLSVILLRNLEKFKIKFEAVHSFALKIKKMTFGDIIFSFEEALHATAPASLPLISFWVRFCFSIPFS